MCLMYGINIRACVKIEVLDLVIKSLPLNFYCEICSNDNALKEWRVYDILERMG